MTETDRSRWFVSTDWLAERLSAPDIVVVDGSWYLPTANRDAYAEYLAAHIPGAVFFDVDAVADTSTGLPHMLPRPEVFSAAVRKLGIGDGQHIIVYDGAGLFSAARVWWTFRAFGARHVHILDGGLPKWRAEGRPVEEGLVTRTPRHFTARLDHTVIRKFEQVCDDLESGEVEVVDVRSADRFRGEAPEPRPGLRSGHMPGSKNLPFTRLVGPDGRLADPKTLAAAFAEAKVDFDKPVVTTCGSGVSAAIAWLALETLGRRPAGLYDGAWAEWGSRPDAPVATGPA